ncbi:glyoxylate/hydroxypyruvate reductase GhrB [Candidatus Sodalis sp. SoCistrobi]|uniref:glyoxylate/hydroxypyruvate reductase GhrB n=1 Tax=Candidatus Sodalis sp. SoCistrobi TaxID=1922216 RepID=UPI00093A8BB3|nr:glyoxylate/hydroxypyruvate reductase GhrB [Candidatus Sodalis sp. SoCistrobi]
MKPAVILYKAIPEDLRRRLDDHFSVTAFDGLTDDNLQQHAPALTKAVGLIGAGGKVDETLLERMPALKAASTISVGYDNFDVQALSARGVLLMHTPTVLTDTVADTLMALVLATARRVVESAERVKAGEWQRSIDENWYGVNVHHKTLGVVGMGRIGMALAQRAHAGFNMDILYHARSQHPEAEQRYDARYCELDTLLAQADFVCLILPLTEQTHHLIDAAKLAKMKPGAILINAGRGPVVDEAALITALENRTLFGAGLDVFEQEPLPVTSPLLRLPNVVALPHIGSATHETRYNMAADAVNNLITALTGRVEKNCVNPEILPGH